MSTESNPEQVAQLVACGRRLFDRGLVSSTGGNISCRVDDAVLVSATGACLADLDADSIVRVSLDGRPLGLGRPSKELPVHLRIYQTCPEVGGIVHGHSPFAVAASTLLEVSEEDALPAYSAGYLIRVGRLPLLPFLESGSSALAEGVAAAIRRAHHAVLLRNHGFFSVGSNLAVAFYTADELQDALRVYILSGGKATPLPPDVRERILAAQAAPGGRAVVPSAMAGGAPAA
jgi:ribulose-5-phosphate 4-epimerase/fuculose-1-phosphate aldolase